MDRIRAVRERLAAGGPPRLRAAGDFVTVSLPGPDCDRLRDRLIAERVGTVVEIGLAYGSSALAIGEALSTVDRPDARHVIVDPFQDSAYADAGWELLGAAGLHAIATLIRTPSSIALPRLVTEGLVADAAFVDGSHRYHEVFTDLYFLRQLVRPGGLIVLDDCDKAPVRAAVRYYQVNLGWVPRDGASRCRAYRLPDERTEPPFEAFQPFWPPSTVD